MMRQPLFKYLHIDSADRNSHETSSKIDIHLNQNPITNVQRVGVLKASITNTGHNVYTGHDSLEIGVKINGATDPLLNDTTAHAVVFTLPHNYYTIDQLISAITAQFAAYTNANDQLEDAIKKLNIEIIDEGGGGDPLGLARVKISAIALTDTDYKAYYALIVRQRTRPNSILPELGFNTVGQTITQATWVKIATALGNGSTINVKNSDTSTRKVIDGSSAFTHTANHTYRIENPCGFFISSSTLTSGGNVLKTSINERGISIVEHDSHLVYIPNKSNRNEFNHYETNIVEWHEVNGDIQNFDIELRSHFDTLISTSSDFQEDAGTGSAIPPFQITLIFECSRGAEIQEDKTKTFQAEAYYTRHQQN